MGKDIFKEPILLLRIKRVLTFGIKKRIFQTTREGLILKQERIKNE